MCRGNFAFENVAIWRRIAKRRGSVVDVNYDFGFIAKLTERSSKSKSLAEIAGFCDINSSL